MVLLLRTFKGHLMPNNILLWNFLFSFCELYTKKWYMWKNILNL